MNRKCSGFVIVVLVAVLSGMAFAQTQGSKSEEKTKSNGTEQKLTQMEKDLWEAWKNHDVEPFKKAMGPQSVNVNSGGVAGTEQALKDLGSSDCKVNGYSLADTNFTWLDKNTVLMTYKADQVHASPYSGSGEHCLWQRVRGLLFSTTQHNGLRGWSGRSLFRLHSDGERLRFDPAWERRIQHSRAAVSVRSKNTGRQWSATRGDQPKLVGLPGRQARQIGCYQDQAREITDIKCLALWLRRSLCGY